MRDLIRIFKIKEDYEYYAISTYLPKKLLLTEVKHPSRRVYKTNYINFNKK